MGSGVAAKSVPNVDDFGGNFSSSHRSVGQRGVARHTFMLEEEMRNWIRSTVDKLLS